MSLKSRLCYIRDVVVGTSLCYTILIKYYIPWVSCKSMERSLDRFEPIAKRLGYGEALAWQRSVLFDN